MIYFYHQEGLAGIVDDILHQPADACRRQANAQPCALGHAVQQFQIDVGLLVEQVIKHLSFGCALLLGKGASFLEPGHHLLGNL
ncbi:hypothetical protein D3C80_1384520 [compost metagenome]